MFTITVFALFGLGGSTEAPLEAGASPASDSKVSESAPVTQPDSAPLISWGDYDGDGFPDLYAIYLSGEDRMFRNSGDGSFTDVTVAAGLSGNVGSRSAQWADYDQDGFLDLYVAADREQRRLFKNRGTGAFDDMTRNAGLATFGEEIAAAWIDYDADTYPDLAIHTISGDRLLHNTAEGWFEPVQLGIPVALPSEPGSLERETGEENRDEAGVETNTSPSVADHDESEPTRESDVETRREPAIRRALPVLFPWPSGSSATIAGVSLSGGINPPIATCIPTMFDQAGGPCLGASSAPTLGRLFPISLKLFVSSGAAGNVGIGTTSPTAKLHVEGTGRLEDTLTLSPSGDQALNVSTGSIFKGGVLFLHTKGGGDNTALGSSALANVTTGYRNTASGHDALFSNTTGSFNSASGDTALRSNTTGSFNTASGFHALFANTTGTFNVATGMQALESNTTGSRNAATGYRALSYNTTGNRNTAMGHQTLLYSTSGSSNTATGYRALHHNTTGSGNTASGYEALFKNTFGVRNTATGLGALSANTTGSLNTASGSDALGANTTGPNNTATGHQALHSNTTGGTNTAIGGSALQDNTTGNQNTAIGSSALLVTTGNRNTALGSNAGLFLTTGSDNIMIGSNGQPADSDTIRIGHQGTQTKTFIAGIRGVTTVNANAIPVLIDGTGQLGTISSSRRFKKDIAEMADATERLLELRPVVFRYKQEQTDSSGAVPMEYGLIAEEVADVFPDLVVYDEEGLPLTVKYHLLSSMLLNEFKKQAHELEKLRNDMARLDAFEARLRAIEGRAASAAPPLAVPVDHQ